MKLLGDVPEVDRQLALDLTEHESLVDLDDMPLERKAQSYICMAHDWYHIGVEEEGNRLLLKAENVYPGYFKNKLTEHTLENKDFDKLVKNITIELLYILVNQLKSN